MRFINILFHVTTGISAVFTLLILTGIVSHIVTSYEKLADLDTFPTGSILVPVYTFTTKPLASSINARQKLLPSNNKQITPTLVKHLLIGNKQPSSIFNSNLFVIINFFLSIVKIEFKTRGKIYFLMLVLFIVLVFDSHLEISHLCH